MTTHLHATNTALKLLTSIFNFKSLNLELNRQPYTLHAKPLRLRQNGTGTLLIREDEPPKTLMIVEGTIVTRMEENLSTWLSKATALPQIKGAQEGSSLNNEGSVASLGGSKKQQLSKLRSSLFSKSKP